MPLNALMESILQQRCVDGSHSLVAFFTKHQQMLTLYYHI